MVRNTIKKILKESDFDWASGIKSALPDRSFLREDVNVTIPLHEFLLTQYGYNFIDIILTDGRIIELKIEGYDNISYDTYDDVNTLIKQQQISVDDKEFTIEDYIHDYDLDKVSNQVDKVIREVLPLDIMGIYYGVL